MILINLGVLAGIVVSLDIHSLEYPFWYVPDNQHDITPKPRKIYDIAAGVREGETGSGAHVWRSYEEKPWRTEAHIGIDESCFYSSDRHSKTGKSSAKALQIRM